MARMSAVGGWFGDDGGHARVAAEGVEGGDVVGQAAVELRELHLGPAARGLS